MGEFSRERGEGSENGPLAEKWQDRKSNRTMQKNTRGDRKRKSNDSPEIQDRWETSDIPGLPSVHRYRPKQKQKGRERNTVKL